MSITTWLYIILIWVLLNAILPVLFRSLERIYQPQIDWLVKSLVIVSKWVVLRSLQLFLICFFAPNIVVVKVLESLLPGIFSRGALTERAAKQKAIFLKAIILNTSYLFYFTKSLVRWDFWDVAVKEYRRYTEEWKRAVEVRGDNQDNLRIDNQGD